MTLESAIFDHVEENGRTYHRYSDGSKNFFNKLEKYLTNQSSNCRIYLT
jgi:hypothetical protein